MADLDNFDPFKIIKISRGNSKTVGRVNIGFETILKYLIYYLALFEMNWNC